MTKKKSRWQRAGEVKYDDHDAVKRFDQAGKAIGIKWWLQLKRYVKPPKGPK